MALTKDEIKEFKKEEKEAEDCTDFYFIADQISDAGDKEWAKNLYKKAEEKVDDFDDLKGLSESVFENLDDEEWSRNLYKRADNQAESYDDLRDLAESLCEILGDKEWARDLYKKAVEKADDDERDDDDPSILEPRLDSRLEIDDSRASVVAGAELTSIFVKPTPVIVRPSGDSYLASI